MYNAKYIIPGLVVFVGIFTLPIWLNLFSPKYVYPEVALPQGQVTLYGGSEPVTVDAGAGCVEPREWMRANHMSLLLDWRDEALRDEKRCHANKADFCDKCHDQNSVNPYCWDCHVIPQGNNHEFE